MSGWILPPSKILDQAVSSIMDAIRSIPDRKVGADAAPGFVRDLGVPFEKAELLFRAPESIVVAGSHSIRSIAKPDVNVGLLVRIPKVEKLKEYLFPPLSLFLFFSSATSSAREMALSKFVLISLPIGMLP